MGPFRLRWRLLAIVIGFAGPFCLADEPLPSVESVLEKWEEASQKCRTLDARLKVFRYDRDFSGDVPAISHGRFYYEAPNIGRYELAADAQDLSEVIIWNGNETLLILTEDRICLQFPWKQLQETPEPPEAGLGWLFSVIYWALKRPQDMMPLVVDIRAAEVQERFRVRVERISDEGILLKALPKRSADAARFSQIEVILSRETYLTTAIQWVGPSGSNRWIFVLWDPKINQPPADRDQLLAPDLSDYQIVSGL